MKPPLMEPRLGPAWVTECREMVHRLEDTAPRGYDGTRVAPYRAQQSTPGPPIGGVYPTEALDLIPITFDFNGRRVLARLTRVAMVGLLKAMREEPKGIEIGFGNGFFATWRSWGMQNTLYENYKAGGPLAAPPGKSWHHRCALDLGVRTEDGRAAMIRAGFEDLLPQDPPHFVWGRRG